jgi:NADP-dependent 3-hydroxy acid dehydrogenase YdfG
MSKKVLIIGGNATMCDGIITELEKNKYEIDLLTYYDSTKINNNNYKWKFLNLLDQDSTDSFINSLEDDYYDKIICTPTYWSGTNNPFVTTREYLNEVYGKFVINYMVLIRNLLKKITKDGHIIYISSIAANIPVDMVDYSAAKAVMQAYVSAISKKAKDNQVIYSIAPEMIYETIAFYHRDKDNFLEPIDKLIKKEQIAKVILNANLSYNGNVVIMGYDETVRLKGFKVVG